MFSVLILNSACIIMWIAYISIGIAFVRDTKHHLDVSKEEQQGL